MGGEDIRCGGCAVSGTLGGVAQKGVTLGEETGFEVETLSGGMTAAGLRTA